MTVRTVTILLVCAIVSVAGAVYGVGSRVSFQETQFEGQAVFPGLLENAGDVREVVVTQQGRVMTFERIDGGWTLAESGNYPVHDNLVSKAIFSLANLEFLEPKTEKPSRHATLQLEAPDSRESKSQRIALKNADGAVMADLIVGSANYFLPETTTGGMYIRRPGEDQTWLARGLVDLGVEARDWLVREIVDIDPERIARAEVTQPDGDRLIVRPNPDVTGGFEFANMPDGRQLKSQFAPRNVAAVLNSFVLNNVRRADAVDLDPAQAYVTRFETEDGIRIVTRMWRGEGETRYMTLESAYTGTDPDSEAAKKAADIAARTDGWAYIIPEYQFDQVSRKMADVTEEAKPES